MDFSAAVRAVVGDPFEWIRIPAGEVVLEDASERGGRKGGRYHIPAFAIAKFPVTVSQFEAFMEDKGYGQKAFWTEAGWQWKQKEKITLPRYWNDKAYEKF